MNRYTHITILLLLIASQAISQTRTWKQYNITTGITNDITINLVSTGQAANTQSNPGILSKNFSGDTGRSFYPLDIINDPSAYPWRMTVNINGTTGILIDPYHVLTAGHVISFSPSFGNIKIIPSFSYAGNPYQYAYPVKAYLLSDYSICEATDIGIIQLDRPLGILTGWSGVGYTTDTSFYRKHFFNNPSYPSAAPFDGTLLYNWKGIFDANYTDYLYSFRTGISGMSGSPALTLLSGNYVTYAFLISSGVKFNRLTASKYDAINSILNYNIPSSINLLPLVTNVYPNKIKQGNKPDSLSFILTNYSSQSVSNYHYNVKYYISSDSIVNSSDELIGSYDYTDNLPANSSLIKTQKTNLPTINKSTGKYWVGVVLSNGKNTGILDVIKIEVINTDNYIVKGRVTSSQNGSGINGVNLTGFPENVTTDYNGYYSYSVPAGFSGNITVSLAGCNLTPSSFAINNIGSGITQNISLAKKTFTISGKFSSPNSGKGIWGYKLTGLNGEPITDNNGNYSATVYYGWSGIVSYYKEGYTVTPYQQSYSNLTASATSNATAGLKIFGYIYSTQGVSMPNVYLSGLGNGSIFTDSIGYYSAILDSGWSGTVTPILGVNNFNPHNRVYSNISFYYSYQDYQQTNVLKNSITLKVILSGSYYKNSDTMTTTLNYKSLLPLTPPDTFSGKTTPFIYKRQSGECISANFLKVHPEVVDWVSIELKNNKFNSIDTTVALLCRNGRIISIAGDTLIPFRDNVAAGSYYVIIRHRNHIAVMSAEPVTLTTAPAIFDFTSSLTKYYGGDAKLLKTGLYGLYTGDANCDGAIDSLDFNLYNLDNRNATEGYKCTDFNLSGFINSADFMFYAPNKQNKIKTNIK